MSALEVLMEKGKAKAEPREAGEQAANLAKTAMENYLQFFQKSMAATPWAGTGLTRTMAGFAQANLSATFDLAQRMTQAKDLQEVMLLQTAFFQKQLQTLTDQAKVLGEIATKSAAAKPEPKP
jgi:phasin family protein